MTSNEPAPRPLGLSEIASFDVGRYVECDACGGDLTDDTRTGGLMFGSYVYGPCCEQKQLARIAGYGEESHIRGLCPPGMAFADWIRRIRSDRPLGNTVRIYGGSVMTVTGTRITRLITLSALAYVAAYIGWQAVRAWGHHVSLTVNPLVLVPLLLLILTFAAGHIALVLPDEPDDPKAPVPSLADDARDLILMAVSAYRWLKGWMRRSKHRAAKARRAASRHARKGATA